MFTKRAIMNIARSTGVLLLVVVSFSLFSAGGAKKCGETQLLQGCISQYKALLKRKPSPEQHCSRLQDVVSCFAKDPSCKGESINRFRFWILQVAMLEAKLNICPQVDFKSLKDSIENTDVADEYVLVEDYDQGDPFISCAAQVHVICSQKFIDLAKKNQRICGDAIQWFACYTKTSDEKSCNSPTIKQYAEFVEKIGVKLVSDALFAKSCKNEL
ncbi:uncharacterized protein LOC144641972 isoform X1 [Oculina patagonica]